MKNSIYSRVIMVWSAVQYLNSVQKKDLNLITASKKQLDLASVCSKKLLEKINPLR